jgi:hypothetical protein
MCPSVRGPHRQLQLTHVDAVVFQQHGANMVPS